MKYGIHVPRQRNLAATAEYARDIGCTAFQIFSGNPVGWGIGRLNERDRDAFRAVVQKAGMGPVLVHAPYLINLATGDRRLRALSKRTLADAMGRAVELSAGPAVVHAGNHKGAGSAVGVERSVAMIGEILESVPGEARLAVEGGAGKGQR